eukprot:208205-Chlamydomonas_euryale.AAC.1
MLKVATERGAGCQLGGGGDGGARTLLVCEGPGNRGQQTCVLLEAALSSDGCGWQLTLKPPLVLHNNIPAPMVVTMAATGAGGRWAASAASPFLALTALSAALHVWAIPGCVASCHARLGSACALAASCHAPASGPPVRLLRRAMRPPRGR